jgi:flagellar biosynthesis protein FliR
MHLQVASATLAALLLATARGTGFVMFAPPFNNTGIPMPVKGALALALAVVVSGRIAPGLPPLSGGFLIVGALSEVAIGAALGFAVIDAVYALGGRISPIYLADAVAELALAAVLGAAAWKLGRERVATGG